VVARGAWSVERGAWSVERVERISEAAYIAHALGNHGSLWYACAQAFKDRGADLEAVRELLSELVGVPELRGEPPVLGDHGLDTVVQRGNVQLLLLELDDAQLMHSQLHSDHVGVRGHQKL